MLSNLEFFITEAFRSFRRSALLTTVAVGTISVALVLFGMFLLIILNLGNMVGSVSSMLDISVYVEKDLSLEEAGALQIELTRIPGVEKVDFISRTEAWKKFKEDYGEQLNLGEIIDENPLPHTFAVKVHNPEILPEVARRVAQVKGISEVRYSWTLINQIKTLMDAVRIGGASLVVLIALATLFIVVNTIRLTVLARETDIYIMKLVGATNTFVKWPFIIEGIMIGILGSVFSFLVLKFSYDAVISRISMAMPFLPVVTDSRLLAVIYSATILGGTALGMLGAYISVSKVLKAEI
jgi:cell division transport system permease protein